jgi:CRISPR-associated protein Cas2
MRHFYLVSYDIDDDKRRAHVAKCLEGYGERVQYSVFCCQLNARECLRLYGELKELLNEKEDQVLFVIAGSVLGENPLPELRYIGKKWKPLNRTQVV